MKLLISRVYYTNPTINDIELVFTFENLLNWSDSSLLNYNPAINQDQQTDVIALNLIYD